jgi:phosphomevalonate kinase
MLLPIHASAPGKLIICGEYAVLDAGPAISMAVENRARVTIEPAGDNCILEIITSECDVFEFNWTDAGDVYYPNLQPEERGTMLRQVVNALKLSLPATMPLVRIIIDSSEFYSAETAQKLGVGSSAAVCVALTGALHRLFGSTIGIDELCFRVHRAFQGGKGSGVDVATSLSGGLIGFQNQLEARFAELPQIRHLKPLEGLHILPVWTGYESSTSEMLNSLDLYRNQGFQEYEEFINSMSEICAQLVVVWGQQNIKAVLDLLALYSTRLQKLDAAAGMGIYSQPHLDFQCFADHAGVVYKPSGAGGGDFGLFFTESEEIMKKLKKELTSPLVFSEWKVINQGLKVRPDISIG